jgi:predicted metal-dependent hydrolase
VTSDAGRRAGGVLSAGGDLRTARVVDPRGRAKVLRPLPAEEREAAVARGLAAYARGDFYLAHEELEPAWMAEADPGERELLGGLIKVAAAFVHAARGNPAGVRTNLCGARERLAGAAAAGRDGGLDLVGLLAAIDDRLARLEAEVPVAAGSVALPGLPVAPEVPVAPGPDPTHDVAGPPGRARRPPLALEPPTLARRSLA